MYRIPGLSFPYKLPWQRIVPSLVLLLAVLVPFAKISSTESEEERKDERQAMVDEIAREVAETHTYLGKKKLEVRVLGALRTVPRHKFVPERLQGLSYENRPLPIGYGQTISQPYIVAVMTDLLELEEGDRVLEIGTGSGYQAAVLSELVAQVFTIEIIEPLAERAADVFSKLNYDNIWAKKGDGYFGWPEQAPFDAIVVTAAASHIPPPLVAQLKEGGRMMLPVGSTFTVQQLVLVEKKESGAVTTRQVLPVSFVPLTGGH